MQEATEQINPEQYAGGRSAGWLVAAVFLAAALLAGAVQVYGKYSGIARVEPLTFLLIGLGFAAAQRRMPLGKPVGVYLLIALLLLAGWTVLSKTAGELNWSRLLTWLAAFLLFPVVVEAWRQFNAVTVGSRPVWVYSLEIPDSQPFAYLENKAVRLRVLSEDGLHEEFPANAPLSMPLGLIFFYAVKEGRSKEEWERYFVNEDGRPAAWAFYTPGLVYGRKYLFPYETLDENDVEATSVIVAERLEKSVAVQHHKTFNA